MSTNYTSLPGIVKILSVPCSSLQKFILERYASGLPLAVLSPTQNIRFAGSPTCKRTTEVQNNGKSTTVELQFSIPGHYVPPTEPTAYVVVTASGAAYLIGAKERPFPAVTVEETTGTPSGDASQTEVTVKHTATVTLIPVVV